MTWIWHTFKKAMSHEHKLVSVPYRVVKGSQKKKGVCQASVRAAWWSSTIKICHGGEEWTRPTQASAKFSGFGFVFCLVCWFFFFFKEELKRPSQSTRCRRQSVLMVRLLNTLWIFTVDQQKVMKHRCSCNCDTLGKFILLNEPQLHTSTCVMWKCTVGTRGYNRRYVGMITGWFRTC